MLADWEAEIKPSEITVDQLGAALVSGCWRLGKPLKDGRPCIWIDSGRWNPHEYDVEVYRRNVAFFCHHSVQSMPAGVSQHVIVFDQTGWALWQAKYMGCVAHTGHLAFMSDFLTIFPLQELADHANCH